MKQNPAWVAGEEVVTGRWDPVLNPFTREAFIEVAALDASHVDAACQAAQKALERKDFPQHKRAEVLDATARLIAEHADYLATLIVTEAGKPLRDAKGEVSRAIDTFRFSAAECRRLSGEMVAMEASAAGTGRLGFALRRPIGVVAAITPFNFPLNLVAHKLAPAVAAGCPVVLKPADKTPISALRLVALMREAGLPADWISVVLGDGESVGQPLIAHPIPKVISFTGSVPVGKAIAKAAPDKKVLLELGSNSPVILAEDADLDRAVGRIRVGGFSYAGQSCISTQRILVHRSRHAELVEKLGKAVGSIVVGDPADEATEVGPLIRPSEIERILGWINAAVERGATLVTGGTVTGGLLEPTVLDTPPWDSEVVSKEIFGPVVTVTPFDSFADAIRLANDSDFGLQVGLFTQDVSLALKAVEDLDFGGVLINEVPTFRADQQPYGGLRDAGNTREGPAYAVHEFTELRFVMLTP